MISSGRKLTVARLYQESHAEWRRDSDAKQARGRRKGIGEADAILSRGSKASIWPAAARSTYV
jgi:hypothetical protein